MITILFNSFAFLYFSIIVLFAIIIIRKRKYQYLFLLAASYFFYWYSSGAVLMLLLFSTFLDFFCGQAVFDSEEPKKRKLFLMLSICGNLGVLGIFKYTNFSLQSISYLASLFGWSLNLPIFSIILPIGISFYTFQAMSYTLDIYFRKLKPIESLLKFALYISFFPQLVAGPIVRAADLLPQLANKIIIISENFKAGFTLVMWGLVKKVVFADNIAVFANAFFQDPSKYPGSLPVFLGALAFGIQIYCDFSGYSDIAIGLAKIMGFTLRLNFDKPYFATNFTIFWRKWHVSLSSWLRDYLYIPLGGNRKGYARTYINLMLTMILGGLWHGAAWNFVLWGFYQGVMLALHKFCLEKGVTRIFGLFGSLQKYAALILTQYFVFLGWLFFRISDTGHLKYAVLKYLSFDISGISAFAGLLKDYNIPIFFLFLFLAMHIFTFFRRDFIGRVAKADIFYWGIYLLTMFMALLFLSAPETVQFIYFQF